MIGANILQVLTKTKMIKEHDNCYICHGSRGGVKGNENIIDNIVLCDYCMVDYLAFKNKLC